jgi:hypothetical protein
MTYLNDISKLFTSTEKFQKPLLDKFKIYLDKISFLNSNTSADTTESTKYPDFKQKLKEIEIKIKNAKFLIETKKLEIENLDQREKDFKIEISELKFDLANQKKFTNCFMFFSIKVILWNSIFILILILIYRRLGFI